MSQRKFMHKLSFSRNFLILFFVSLFGMSSCSKELEDVINGTGTSSALEQYFETNILNRDFIVTLATNNGTNITANYNGYVFKMLKTTFYQGPAQVTKGSTVYTGSWSSNNDYSKLVITLPSTPVEFVFLTREWKFTKKLPPQLELAPWGTTEPIVLHLLRQ